MNSPAIAARPIKGAGLIVVEFRTMLPPPAVPSFSSPPLGRKRTRHFDLPPRLHRKGGSFYYVANHPRRWIPLGPDLDAARRRWAELECAVEPTLTVGDLVDRYVKFRHDDLAPATRKQYRAYAKTLRAQWPDLPACDLRAPAVALFRDDNRHRKGWINGCLAVLSGACAKGREWGVLEIDPLVDGFEMEPRDRYVTDDEYRAIYAHAPAWLQVAMDLAYLCASRPIDVRLLRWESVLETVGMRQQKTKQRMAFRLTPEVAAVLERARARPILGLYVVATDKGRPIGRNRLLEAWKAACAAAGVEGAQFRDLRAKGATDAAESGQDYQRLLGHSNRRMSDRYIKRRRTIIAEPVRRKL